MLGAKTKDDLKAVEQFRMLVGKPSRQGQVRPLHVLANREPSNDGVSVLNRLASNERPYLLDEAASPASRSSAIFRMS